MPYTEVRAAQPEDRAAVLAFCAHTWEWGDYIEYAWDEWLHDPNGLLFVATVDGQPVGIGHLRMLTHTEAWLEGMRVDPNYRRRGIAAALHHEMLAEAMRRGATTARLITESTNSNSIRLLEHGFFRQVAAYAPFKAAPVTIPSRPAYGLDRPILASTSDIEEIIEYLDASNVFPIVGGLYYRDFIAYAITDSLLSTKIAAQQVYLLRRWNRLDGLAIAEPSEGRRGQHLFIGYIDGTTAESVGLIAYALRSRAAELGLESVHANVPDLVMVRDAFVGAEYEWDEKIFYTYERSLV
jgi:GNAT superfamily N-acetyltransferase